MKIILQFLCLFLLHTPQALSNNVQVSNVRLTGQDTTNDFTMVEFAISWENSWRYSGGPANWDAAWIFVKYRVGVGGEWKHAWLNNTGHTSCSNTTITNGLLSPSLPFHVTTNPALGVFLYRSTPGTGIFSCQDVQLRWNYGAMGVLDGAQVDIKVFAIEMAYIPERSFYVGSGGTEPGAFYTYPTTIAPYLISSESPITIGTSPGNLFYNNSSGFSGDQTGILPADFPKGYAAFYAMKYEISQKGYVDFLNTLTRAQQINRVRANISGTNVPNEYVMSVTSGPWMRSGVSCRNTIPPSPAMVEFFCDLNGNAIPNENSDGLGVPCNYLTYGDVASYLDWAGLRLWTEFEFEKCGRGPIPPIPNEFAWGTQVIYVHSGLLNEGQPTEAPAEYYSNVAGPGGPVRNGAFARDTSDREQAGAGYYGCMDISGNVYEKGVSIGTPQGRTYTGVHGNGTLSVNGIADVVNWPPSSTADGVFGRGGSCIAWEIEEERLSDRFYAGSPYPGSNEAHGGRGVRTAE